MKKTFPLHAPGKAAPRVIEAIKHDVRKYVKRERAKSLPEGFEQWEFNCKVGTSAATAEAKTLNDVAAAIDAVALAGGTEVYVEVLAVAGHRAPRVTPPMPAPAIVAPSAAPAPAPPQSS